MIFIMINSCVIILRQTSKTQAGTPPTASSTYMQLWSIVQDVADFLMGSKAFVGGAVAVVVGIATYYIYGKKH